MKIIFRLVLCFMVLSGLFSFNPTSAQEFPNSFGSLFEKGESLMLQGRWEEALLVFREGYAKAESAGDWRNMVESLMHLGLMNWNLGRMKTSQVNYSQALSIAENRDIIDFSKKCRELLSVYDLYDMGKTLRGKGEKKKSIARFERAIAIARANRSRDHELKCLRQMSINYWDLNELAVFLKLNEEALALARDLNHRAEQGKCLNHIGLFYWKSSDYSRALSFYFQALSIAQGIGNKLEISACLNNIGLIYKDFGYYEQALDYLERALILDKESGVEEFIAIDLNNIGSTYVRMSEMNYRESDLKQALIHFKACLSLAEKANDTRTIVNVLNNLGSLYLTMDKQEKARSYLEEARTAAENSGNLEGLGVILNNLGDIYLKEGRLDTALDFFQRATSAGEAVQRNDILWEAGWMMGQYFEAQDRMEDAIRAYEGSLRIIESIRSTLSLDTYRAGYLQHKLKVYESLIHLLSRGTSTKDNSSQVEKIFSIVERAKARAFLDMIAGSQVDYFEKLDPETLQNETDLSNEISALMRSLYLKDLTDVQRKGILEHLRYAEDRYMQLLSQIRVHSPSAAEFIAPKLDSLNEIQRGLLDEKTVLLEYFLGERGSYLFIVTRESVSFHPLPPRAKIRESIRGFMKMLSDPPASKARYRGSPAARRLFRELLFPLGEAQYQGIERLIIIPDGVLYYLPFETLEMDIGQADSKTRKIVDRYDVSYAPSSSSMLYLTRNTRPHVGSPSLLAFGSPSYDLDSGDPEGMGRSVSAILKNLYLSDGFDLSPIRFGRKEVNSIARLFPKHKRNVFIGKDAQEAVFKSVPVDSSQIIHFACHGFLDEGFPSRSALVLSLKDTEEEDGFLQVREIYKLRLSAKLVVLSGCQTGRGLLTAGEGILGLPRIFFYAGAKSVLSTVWRIDDKPTALFMKYFYKYLSDGKSRSAALRMAKLRMLRTRYSHPFYWAAFVLYGDPSPLFFLDVEESPDTHP
ncbi:CHAT domain-containing protein [Acidobacteriota bacterium]